MAGRQPAILALFTILHNGFVSNGKQSARRGVHTDYLRPRLGLGNNSQISDFAPNNGTLLRQRA